MTLFDVARYAMYILVIVMILMAAGSFLTKQENTRCSLTLNIAIMAEAAFLVLLLSMIASYWL